MHKNAALPFISVCVVCGTEFKALYYPLRTVPRYCSRQCNLSELNPNKKGRKLNLSLEQRISHRNVRVDRGKGKSYRKFFGRHEHRVIAEQILGRPLLLGEVVHHIDGNKRNNSPNNLEILASQSEHARNHARERRRLKSSQQ